MADCLFCGIVSGAVAAEVVLDRDDVVGFLDIRPLFKGHVLLVPREHVETLLRRGTALAGPAMACAVGAALPLTAQYLAAPFEPWARAVLAAAAVIGFLAVRAFPGRLTGLRLGLGLAAVALVVGWVWP